MPAMVTQSVDDVVEFEIAGLDLDAVQFTDETFEAELVVRNLSDRRLTGTVELVNETERTLGLDREPLHASTLEVDLAPGETHRETGGGLALIGGTGTGVVVGVAEPEVTEPDDETIVLEPGTNLVPLASLVFWDREFYRVNYLRPRRAQYLSVAFALLSALFAGAIAWLSLS